MKTDEKYEQYFSKMRPFHMIYGTGEGGVSILIRKSLSTYLYRLFRFGETNRFVVDGRGLPVVFNHIEKLADVLDYKRKVHAMYEYNGEEWTPEKYNKCWFVGMYGPETTTLKKLIREPYHFWVYYYKSHFFLEKPTENVDIMHIIVKHVKS